MRRPMAMLAVVAVLLLSGCAVGYQPSADSPTAADPADPAEPPFDERLAQYDGHWYNDSLDVDATDGLTEAEFDAVVARAMARVQLLRGLPFEEPVDVELVTRQEFQDRFGEVVPTGPDEDARIIDNAQYRALFLVGPNEDVVDVRQANQGDVILGFYEPSAGRIVVVSSREPATMEDEITLAHELLHALQDQHFDLSERRDDSTLDGVNARNGLIEGEAVVVERAYERNCETGEWECVEVDGGHQPPAPGTDFHFGVYFTLFYPYAEGPSFVEHHRGDRGEWDPIDDMHDVPPTATATVTFPETYGTDAYGEATLEDRSAERWSRVTTDGGPDHARVGQAGLAAMVAYTAFEGPGGGVVERDEFRNVDESGALDRMRPFTYSLPYTEGWYADRLHAFEDGADVALVWNVTFQTEIHAAEFVEGYERVIDHWNGVERERAGESSVWTLDESDEFDGAVRIDREATSVTVVKAPTVDDLADVHEPAGA